MDDKQESVVSKEEDIIDSWEDFVKDFVTAERIKFPDTERALIDRAKVFWYDLNYSPF